MNSRPIGNTSKVLSYLLACFGQMDVPANCTGKKSMLDIKNLSVHGAAFKFKPVSLSKSQKVYLFIVCKYQGCH